MTHKRYLCAFVVRCGWARCEREFIFHQRVWCVVCRGQKTIFLDPSQEEVILSGPAEKGNKLYAARTGTHQRLANDRIITKRLSRGSHPKKVIEVSQGPKTGHWRHPKKKTRGGGFVFSFLFVLEAVKCSNEGRPRYADLIATIDFWPIRWNRTGGGRGVRGPGAAPAAPGGCYSPSLRGTMRV